MISKFEPFPKSWFDISQSTIVPCCAYNKINIGHFIAKLNLSKIKLFSRTKVMVIKFETDL